MPAIVIPAPISSNHAAPVSAGGTGATTAAAARTNLDVYSKSEVTNAISQSTANFQIPSSTAADLNDCIAPGFYRAGSATLNRPESGSRYYAVFVMPFSSTDWAQIAIEVNLTRMHIRSMESGTWHAWKTVTLT